MGGEVIFLHMLFPLLETLYQIIGSLLLATGHVGDELAEPDLVLPDQLPYGPAQTARCYQATGAGGAMAKDQAVEEDHHVCIVPRAFAAGYFNPYAGTPFHGFNGVYNGGTTNTAL